jgi:hypothetical protein
VTKIAKPVRRRPEHQCQERYLAGSPYLLCSRSPEHQYQERYLAGSPHLLCSRSPEHQYQERYLAGSSHLLCIRSPEHQYQERYLAGSPYLLCSRSPEHQYQERYLAGSPHLLCSRSPEHRVREPASRCSWRSRSSGGPAVSGPTWPSRPRTPSALKGQKQRIVKYLGKERQNVVFTGKHQITHVDDRAGWPLSGHWSDSPVLWCLTIKKSYCLGV